LGRDAWESVPPHSQALEIADFAVIWTHLALGFQMTRENRKRHTVLMRPAAAAALATPADALASTARSRSAAIKPILFSAEAIPILDQKFQTAAYVVFSNLCLFNGIAKIAAPH